MVKNRALMGALYGGDVLFSKGRFFMNSAMISAFVLYYAILIGIGLFFYNRMQTVHDYMLGNRSVNYWVTAIATQTSDMGSWLFLGFPSMLFLYGMPQIWTAVGLVVGMWLTWTFVAPALRRKTASLDTLTLSSYFAHSFGDHSGTIQLLSTSFALIFFLFYIASGLIGLSLIFSYAFGFSYEVGITISVVTTVIYTLIGGFVAVAWCDFFQGIFLLIMIILVPTVGLFSLGGIHSIIQVAHMKGIPLVLIDSPKDTIKALFLAASWGLGYFGQPHILVNFMGIDDERNIKRARNLGISWQILVLVAAAVIGLIGIGFFPQGLENVELVFPAMTLSLFHPFVAGLILCAIFAATLSTMDSLILVAGSSLAEDIYKKFLNPQASHSTILLVSRLGSIFIAVIALAFAWHSSSTIYGLVNYAWSGLGSTFGPLVVASLLSDKVTPAGAVAGILAGGATAALWPLFSTILPLVPGFSCGLMMIGLVSWFTQKKWGG